MIRTVCCWLALAAAPHEGQHAQIEAATREIEARPDDGLPLVRRAELYRLHGDYERALLDLDAACARAPELFEADLVRGRVLLARRRPVDAVRALDRFLERAPDDAVGLRARGTAREQLGALAAAERDYARAIAAQPRASPEDYLACARVVCARGDPERALTVLDAGVEQLGPAVPLELCAIELNVQLGRHDAALARIARIERQTPRKESWMARRGDVLRRAGREAEARRAWQGALEEIARLPQKHRRTRAVLELEASLRARLAGRNGE